MTPHKIIPLTNCSLELWENDGACAILLLPGSMLSPAQYSVQVQAFREAGFAVAALHFTGHGSSPCKKVFTFKTFLENIEYAELWLSQHGYPKFFLVGHSQGGTAVLAKVSQGTKAAEAFALSSALPQMASFMRASRFPALAEHRLLVATLFSGLAKICPLLPIPGCSYLSLSRISAGARKLSMPRTGKRSCYPVYFLASLLHYYVPIKASCPITLVYPPNDKLFPPAVAQEICDIYKSNGIDSLRISWVTGGGHLFPFSPELARQVAAQVAVRALERGFFLRSSLWKKV